MNAEAGSFTFLGNEAAVRIPFFQRAYVWEQSNWEDLLTDLLDDTKTHFLGSLILKQQKKQSGKPKEVLVIDGQQRLTTLSILVKTIYDCFPEDLKSSSEASLRTHLFYKQHPTDKHYHVKIQHSQCDAQYYRQVVESGITPAVLANISETSNRILRCYKYFLGELSKRNHSDIEALFNRILDHDNRILVLIDLGEDDEEQAIFDTINSAGVRLSAADIIKNALFQRALELIESQDEVLRMYKDDWEAVFAKDDAAIVYWDAERSTGRLMRDNIEILLHSVAVINGIFDPDKHSLSALSALYKAVIAGQSEDELRRFIAEIKEYALLYKEQISAFDRTTALEYSDQLQRLLHVLDVLELTTFHPFILALLKKYKGDQATLNAILRQLERLVMRQMIAKSDKTKNYNKVCKEFIADESAVATKLCEVADDDVLAGLRSIGNKHAALVLFWIESFRRSTNPKFSVKELTYCYSLEHVMPQKWKEYWHDVPVRDASGAVVADSDQAQKVRQSMIYWIGNMTLLRCSLNSSLRNFTFEIKVKGEKGKKGIKSYADLSITNDDIVIPFDGGDHVWDEAKIAQRTRALSAEVLELW